MNENYGVAPKPARNFKTILALGMLVFLTQACQTKNTAPTAAEIALEGQPAPYPSPTPAHSPTPSPSVRPSPSPTIS